MILKSLITERTETYLTQAPGTAAGTLYNGLAAGSTSTGAATITAGGDGKGISIGKANRALVMAMSGVESGGAVITAWIGSKGVKADDASVQQLTGFLMTFTGTDDSKILKGEIDLRGLVLDAPATGKDGISLWIRAVTTTDATYCITVQLSDFENEPTAEVLTTGYPSTIT